MTTREKDSCSVERLVAQQIYSEMEAGAVTDGVTFDDEQKGFILQALSDAVLETKRRECADQLAALQIPREKILEDTRRFLTFIASGTEINSDDADTAIELARGIEQLRARLAVPQEPPLAP